jgi:nicotinamide-nucleotide amidase
VKEITQLAAELGRRLQVLNAHVTTAESCTGGGIAEAITRVAGVLGSGSRPATSPIPTARRREQLGVPGGAVRAASGRSAARGGRGHGQRGAPQRNKPGPLLPWPSAAMAGPAWRLAEQKPVGTVWLACGRRRSSCSRPSASLFPGGRDADVRRQTVERPLLEGLLRRAASPKEKILRRGRRSPFALWL